MSDNLPTFGSWQTIERMGVGGMCTVYRVRAADGREAAVKVLTDQDETSIARFADEAQMLLSLKHPNILQVHELESEARPPWIVMDLLAGRDLEELRDQGPMDPERAANIIADIANGLALVHAKGVRHRDIKPSNIMLSQDGTAHLIDFGIARDTAAAHKTAAGFVVGTAAYLPPEIFLDDDAHAIQDSESADVYALGQTLCEALTGAPVIDPLQGGAATVLVVVMKSKLAHDALDPREWRSQVPDDLAQIVIAATQQDPANRTPTAKQFEDQLRAWLTARHTGETAPITSGTFDPSSLTVPGSAPPSLPPPEKSPAETSPSDEGPDDAAGGGWKMLFAGSAMGATAVGGGSLLLLLLLLVAGLAVWRPWEPPATSVAAVHATVKQQSGALSACSRKAVNAELSWVASGGKALNVRVTKSSGKTRVDRCLKGAIQGMRFPKGGPTKITLPVHLK